MTFTEIGDYIAVDSSTTSIAFASVKDGNLSKYGKMTFSGAGIYEKLIDISNKTTGLFSSIGVNILVIESSFYSQNPKTATNLALAQGAIIGAAAACGVRRVGTVVPINWQRGIGNKPFTKSERAEIAYDSPGKSASWISNHIRQLRKQKTMDYVNSKFGLNITDDDVADALGIAAYVENNGSKVNWG